MIWLKYIVPLLLWAYCSSQNVCEEPPEVDFAETVSEERAEYHTNDRVQYRCNLGYALEGPEWVTCEGPKWTSPPKCLAPCTITKQQLEAQNLFLSGGRRRSHVIPNDQTLEFQCGEGYVLSAPSVRKCIDGYMDLPSCLSEIVCSPPAVNNGRANPPKQQYFNDETIEIQCDPGYKPEREATSRCTKTGWQPQPRCIAKRCDYPEGGNIQLYRNYYSYFPKSEGQGFYFMCNTGFLPANKQGSGWQYSTCTKSGWEPEPKCFKQCDHESSILHGDFIYSSWHKFIEGNEISFSCHTGYHPEPQEEKVKCTKSGWSPPPRCITREIPTCQRDPPRNGFFTDQKDQFALNERTRYRCHIGFTTRQGEEEGETQCLQEGWTPKPECVETCQRPTEGNLIISVTKSVFFLEDNLPFKCEEGYETLEKTLADSSECTTNGWSPKPQCRPIQCEGLILDHGDIKPRNDQYLYRDVIQFSCRPGRVRVGPISAQCYHFGWSPPPPTCKASEEVQSCQPPSNIANGRIITALQEEYPHGQQVEYECNLKYAMTGSKKVECVDGQWTSLPSCTAERRTCVSPPPPIQNGYPAMTDRERYYHGDTVSYECDEGTAVVGTDLATCLYGKWDLPSCADGCAPPKIRKNIVHEPLRDRYNINEVVSYICDSVPYETKCVKGNWSPELQCRDLCPPPPQPPNAIEIIEVRNYENGEKVRFRCKEHFLLEGPEEIVCEDGKWKTSPCCVDQRCENPPPVANGQAVNGTQGKYLPGIKVEYRCDEGFDISRIKSLTCRNRSWTQTPTCKEKPCGSPPDVFDASFAKSVKKTYQPGEVVEYICHSGFTSDAPLSVTCRKGQWTEHPICEAIQCPPPGEIAHGEMIGQPKQTYMHRDTVHFRCNPGWTLSGPAVVTCLDSQWTNLPKCTDPNANCSRPPGIRNGDVLGHIQAEYEPGARLRYQCQNLYVMNGAAEVRCENGDWTEPPTCIEACTVTEEDMRRNNIELRWRSDPKLYSQSGDEMEFQCIQHHRTDPSSPPLRTRCIEGRVEYPRCIRP